MKDNVFNELPHTDLKYNYINIMKHNKGIKVKLYDRARRLSLRNMC
jgi:hypothetical protein